MKTFYDKKQADVRNYDKGDKVWLEGSNITTTRPSKKLGEKRYGPFEVLRKEGLTAYCLKLPATWKKIHLVFNEALLNPYKPPAYPQQQLPRPAPPIVVEGDKEYEVDEILDLRMRGSRLQYLVCWKDYPARIDWTCACTQGDKGFPYQESIGPPTTAPQYPNHIISTNP